MILEHSEPPADRLGHVNGLGNDGLKRRDTPDDHLPTGLTESLVLSRSPEAVVFHLDRNVLNAGQRSTLGPGARTGFSLPEPFLKRFRCKCRNLVSAEEDSGGRCRGRVGNR